MSVHLHLILSEVNRAGLHGLQELVLVNEGDEDNSFPLLLFPIQIRLEVHRVEVLQWRVFIDHQTLWRNRPVAPSPQTILAQSSRYMYSVASYPDWSGYKAKMLLIQAALKAENGSSKLNSNCYTVVSRKYAPPFCNLSLSTKRRGGLYAGCDNFSRDYALPFDKA